MHDRLAKFGYDDTLKLDAISVELIPTAVVNIEKLEEGLIARLISRIDRRRGPWGRLRRLLQNQESH